MPDAITALGSVLGRDMARMTTHAANIANANTAGFQAQIAGGDPARDASVPVPAFRPGRLVATGKPLDVAIIGEGWLVARSDDGALTLTRNGRLHVATDGLLRTADGLRVQGTGGDLAVGPAARYVVDMTGRVLADGIDAGQLLLAATPTDAVRLPDGRLRANTLPVRHDNARIAAGVLEQSNVDIAQEMTQLMMTSRHLESTQRALQLYDGLLATGIGQIGKE